MVKLFDFKENCLMDSNSHNRDLFMKQMQEKYPELSIPQVYSIISIVLGFIEEVEFIATLDGNSKKIQLLTEVESLLDGDSTGSLIDTNKSNLYRKSFLALINHSLKSLSIKDYLIQDRNFTEEAAENTIIQEKASILAKEVTSILCNSTKRWLNPQTMDDITKDELKKATSKNAWQPDKDKILKKINLIYERSDKKQKDMTPVIKKVGFDDESEVKPAAEAGKNSGQTESSQNYTHSHSETGEANQRSIIGPATERIHFQAQEEFKKKVSMKSF